LFNGRRRWPLHVRCCKKSSRSLSHLLMSSCFLIPTLTETLAVLSPGTVSTALCENWDTGKEYEQPPVLHPFYSSAPLVASYAIQGSSAPTSMQSQTIQQSALSLKTSQSVLTPNILSPLTQVLLHAPQTHNPSQNSSLAPNVFSPHTRTTTTLFPLST